MEGDDELNKYNDIKDKLKQGYKLTEEETTFITEYEKIRQEQKDIVQSLGDRDDLTDDERWLKDDLKVYEQQQSFLNNKEDDKKTDNMHISIVQKNNKTDEIKYLNQKDIQGKSELSNENIIKPLADKTQRQKITEKIYKYKKHKKIMEQRKNDRKKYKNRSWYQAQKDFISSCQWSWNTEDCLKLMKEGLVPWDVVNLIIQKTWGITNKFFSIFNSNASLQSLIGAKNIAILANRNQKCIAIDPNDDKDDNDKKIKEFMNERNIECKQNDVKVVVHGTGCYAHQFNYEYHRIIYNSGTTVLYLSNIPTYGAVATKAGTQQRFEKYKPIIQTVINSITAVEKIKVRTISFGNLMCPLLCKVIADECDKTLDYCSIHSVPRKVYLPYMKSFYDIIKEFDDIKNKDKIKSCSIFSKNDIYHSHEWAKKLYTYLENKISKGQEINIYNTDRNNAKLPIGKDEEQKYKDEINQHLCNVKKEDKKIKPKIDTSEHRDNKNEDSKLNNGTSFIRDQQQNVGMNIINLSHLNDNKQCLN